MNERTISTFARPAMINDSVTDFVPCTTSAAGPRTMRRSGEGWFQLDVSNFTDAPARSRTFARGDGVSGGYTLKNRYYRFGDFVCDVNPDHSRKHRHLQVSDPVNDNLRLNERRLHKLQFLSLWLRDINCNCSLPAIARNKSELRSFSHREDRVLRRDDLFVIEPQQHIAGLNPRERRGIRGRALDIRPRTMSSSGRRAQSSASRFLRNVFEVMGHPILRITAFHFPRSVLTRVAKCGSGAAPQSDTVPQVYLKLFFDSLVGPPGLEPGTKAL